MCRCSTKATILRTLILATEPARWLLWRSCAWMVPCLENRTSRQGPRRAHRAGPAAYLEASNGAVCSLSQGTIRSWRNAPPSRLSMMKR